MKKNYFILALLLILGSVIKAQNVTISGTGVSAIDNGSYSTLQEAIAMLNNDLLYTASPSHNIIITIKNDLTETQRSRLEGRNWGSLSIITDGLRPYNVSIVPASMPDYNNIILELVGVQNVTIDGSNGPEERNLTFTGVYLVDGNNPHTTNSIIWVKENAGQPSNNVTIKNCKFNGGPGYRVITTILGTGVRNMTIENNLFENCFNLNRNDGIVGIISGDDTGVTNYNQLWTIRNNHFYETSPVNFEAATTRTFIGIGTHSATCDFTIEKNYIGGNAPEAKGTFVSGGVGGDIYGIMIVNTSGGSTPGSYSVIKDNVIKNFSCTSSTNVIGSQERIAAFYGIRIENGRTNIYNDSIKNINWEAQGKVHDPSEYYGYHTISGISAVVLGNNSEVICDNNKVSNLRFNILNDWDPTLSLEPCAIMYNPIMVSAQYGGVAVVRNNKVIWGYNSAGRISTESDISGILGSSQGGFGTKLDFYNNISVLEECNMGEQSVWTINVIKLMHENGDTSEFDNTGGVQNLFNNIAYVQPRDDSSFQIKHQGFITGIGVILVNTAEPNRTNVYHNTAYINNFNESTGLVLGSSPLSVWVQSGNGTAHIWNNLFVNRAPKGVAVYTRGSLNQPVRPGSFDLDYNNYYSVNYFGLVHETVGSFLYEMQASFDKWKFDNSSKYFNRSTLHDHHSRNLEPMFGGVANAVINIDLTDISNLDNLRTLLEPHEFLGGRRTEASYFAESNNPDFSYPSGIARRENLPTMGAINTGYSNYWLGTTNNDWALGSNWASGAPPTDNGDVVFSPNAADTLVLNENRKIHDIYNDTKHTIRLNGKELTVTGYIGQERGVNADYAKIEASMPGSTIIYNGSGNAGSNSQHIFANTFVNNEVYNFTLNNQSDYFVLLHDKLNVINDFNIVNQNTGVHPGALNCIWFNTELKFSGSTTNGNNIPQYIPQHSIYRDSVYNLVVNSEKTITRHDNLFVRNNLLVGELITDSNKKFEIEAGKLVKVDGLTTNRGGTAGLTIKSRQNSSEQTPNATFIFSNPETNKVPATVEMFSPAQKKGDGDYQWQYFTVPVEETPITVDMWGTWIRRWEPSGINRDPFFGTPYWIFLEADHSLSPVANKVTYTHPKYGATGTPANNISTYAMQGYEITMDASKVIPFKGNLVNSALSLSLNYNQYNTDNPWTPNPGESWNEQKAMNGQYVLGNPYTAAIDIRKLNFGTNLDSTVYIYTTGSYNEWKTHGSDSNNKNVFNPGQYLAVPQKLAGVMPLLPSQIPSMQGFVIMRKNDTGTQAENTFSFDYTALGYPQTIVKNTDIQRSATLQDEKVYTIVKLESENYQDYLWIFLHPDCKKGYDNGWDGRKFTGSGAAQLFTMEDEELFQVSSMDDIHDTYIGFKAAESDIEYTLTFEHIETDTKYNTIELQDLLEGRTIDITANGSSYTFTSDYGTDIMKRFRISTETRMTTGDKEKEMDDYIDIYNEGKNIFVNNTTDNSGTLQIYDMSGKCMFNGNVEANNLSRIETNLISGSYIVKINVLDYNINKLIIIK